MSRSNPKPAKLCCDLQYGMRLLYIHDVLTEGECRKVAKRIAKLFPPSAQPSPEGGGK